MFKTLQKNTEKTLPTFEDAFNLQPARVQKQLRVKMMFRCGWCSRTTFYNKMYGITPVKPPEKAVIKQLFSEKGVLISFETETVK